MLHSLENREIVHAGMQTAYLVRISHFKAVNSCAFHFIACVRVPLGIGRTSLSRAKMRVAVVSKRNENVLRMPNSATAYVTKCKHARYAIAIK